ncbi:hypothetical protein MTO96_044317 [Rhipicephalus appendiculatus]
MHLRLRYTRDWGVFLQKLYLYQRECSLPVVLVHPAHSDAVRRRSNEADGQSSTPRRRSSQGSSHRPRPSNVRALFAKDDAAISQRSAHVGALRPEKKNNKLIGVFRVLRAEISLKAENTFKSCICGSLAGYRAPHHRTDGSELRQRRLSARWNTGELRFRCQVQTYGPGFDLVTF